jgi:hypothetical protein
MGNSKTLWPYWVLARKEDPFTYERFHVQESVKRNMYQNIYGNAHNAMFDA